MFFFSNVIFFSFLRNFSLGSLSPSMLLFGFFVSPDVSQVRARWRPQIAPSCKPLAKWWRWGGPFEGHRGGRGAC